MADLSNLVYNGDFSLGLESWTGTNLSVSGNVLSAKGNLSNSYLIPISPNSSYKLTFSIKFTTVDAKYFYIALYAYDSEKHQISIASVNKPDANTDTTLAADLNNGDTTVTLTSAANWNNTSTESRKIIGICNNIAWGYNRNTRNAYYSSISGNVLTLSSPWGGGNFAAGTKVANFASGGTYFYPVSIPTGSLPTDWKTYETTFSGGDSIRKYTQFISFNTLGYQHVYQIKDIRLENITTHQIIDFAPNMHQINVSNTGIASMLLNESSCKVRYIKDSINGSNINTYNHWVEIEAITPEGNNIAFNKKIKASWGSNYSLTVVTDGSTLSSSYLGGSGTPADVIVDLGFVTEISKIKVWHYWSDGRIYNNHVISISENGTDWRQVYCGTHAENSAGWTVNLSPEIASMRNSGVFDVANAIEY